jgi:hypothetical protein
MRNANVEQWNGLNSRGNHRKNLSSAVIAGLCLFVFGGCVTREADTLKMVDQANAARLRASYGTQAQLESAIASAEVSGAERNKLLNDLILIVDLNYYEWEQRLFNKKAFFDLGTDATLLGLGGATALAGATGTANILGQITTGITGFKTSVDSDILQKNSIPSMVAKMRAGRQTQLAKMQTAMTRMANNAPAGPSSVEVYSVQQGLLDLKVYHAAGTFVGALQDITAKAAEEKKTADDKINKTKPNATLINQTPNAPGE